MPITNPESVITNIEFGDERAIVTFEIVAPRMMVRAPIHIPVPYSSKSSYEASEIVKLGTEYLLELVLEPVVEKLRAASGT